MRRLITPSIAAVALTVAALTVPALAVGATTADSKKPPVKLSGTVINKGTKTVKGAAIKMDADEFYFRPTFVKAKAGATVAVTITNKGSAPHTFTIDAQDIDRDLDPGDKVTVDVTLPANGKPAVFYCRFHKASGMQGAFYSKAGAKASAQSTSDPTTSSPGSGYGY